MDSEYKAYSPEVTTQLAHLQKLLRNSSINIIHYNTGYGRYVPRTQNEITYNTKTGNFEINTIDSYLPESKIWGSYEEIQKTLTEAEMLYAQCLNTFSNKITINFYIEGIKRYSIYFGTENVEGNYAEIKKHLNNQITIDLIKNPENKI